MTDIPLTRRSPVAPRDCNLAKSFELIGDKWSLLILRTALYGVRRFEDFQAELQIPRTVLSARLSRLVDNGLLKKQAYRLAGSRPRPEYWLTPKGQALQLPFLAMNAWGDRWIGNGKPPAMIFKDRSTGDRLHVAIVDSGGREVAATDMIAERAGQSRNLPKRQKLGDDADAKSRRA
jgi:DNA-binding HxlR family transcriptional regulator